MSPGAGQVAELPDLAFDYHVVAEYIADSRRRSKKEIPSVASLATAITSVELRDTMEGSSTLTATLVDPEWRILPFFDINEDGNIEFIELNYPPQSRNWWRMTALEIDSQTDSTILTLIFMERPAVLLTHHYGPIHGSRAKYTRAEFLKFLVDKVKANGGIRFHSKELHDKQDIAGNAPAPTDTDKRRRVKSHGIAADAKVKIKRKQATPDQIREANTAFDVAYRLDAPDKAFQAMACAGIAESDFIAQMNKGGSGYGGVFQGDVTANTRVWAKDWHDTGLMARYFLKGGKGFQGGGAIKLATEHSEWSPGKIALTVEGSRQNFTTDDEAEHFYQQWAGEAEDLVKAYGGVGSGGPSYYRQQFNFRIGDDDNPRIDYWTGMQDLAEEVNWRLFVDGNTVYFDSDYALIKQTPVLTIDRFDPTVIGYNARWDGRHKATEMTLTLICDPFAYRAGEVFQLTGFGPLSFGSTARPDPLPGRWLIFESARQSGDVFSTFTLTQPERPHREPAAEVGQRAQDDEEVVGDIVNGVDQEMTPKEIIDQYVLPIGRNHDLRSWVGALTPENVVKANNNHDVTTTDGNPSDHRHNGDGTEAWAVDMTNGDNPTAQMDACAKELGHRFDIGKDGRGIANYKAVRSDGKVQENLVSVTHGIRRYQLIYRTTAGGDHYDHVHFGVKILSGPPSPGT